MSIATKLAKLKTIKQDIKSALEEKGQTPSNVFSTYANNIRAIETGGSGEITIPSVTNLVVSEKGVATWNAPDLTSLAEYNPVISYLVSVNDGEAVETSNTTLNLRLLLNDGTNTISVVVKALLTNKEDTSITIEYSKPTESITTLSATLPLATMNIGSAAVGTNIYLFGGFTGDLSKAINKFDTTAETITTLSVTLPYELQAMAVASVGANIYLFGGISSGGFQNKIYQFDTTTETITTLNVTLPTSCHSIGIGVVGTNIYLFGGYISSTNILNSILLFDSEKLTLTNITSIVGNLTENCNRSCVSVGTNIYLFGGRVVNSNELEITNQIWKLNTNNNNMIILDVTLPKEIYQCASVLIGKYIYIFGGLSTEVSLNTINRFDTTTETITTLSITLPTVCNGMSSSVVSSYAYIFGGYSADSGRLKTILKFIA